MDTDGNSINDSQFEESLNVIMRTLPAAIRQYFEDSAYIPVVQDLSATYSLHIDQAGVLVRNVILLLLGIEDPNEFAAALKNDGGIPDALVTGIMKDVNERIFVPLRDKMEKGTAAKAPEAAPPSPVAPPAPAANRPDEKKTADNYAPPLQSPRYLHSEYNDIFVKTMDRSSSLSPAPHAPAHPAPAHPQPAQAPRAVPPPLPPRYTQSPIAENEKLLEDREEPHISFNNGVSQQPARTPTPPPNLPGAMPPAMPSINRIPPPPSINRIMPPPPSFAPPSRIFPPAAPLPPTASTPIAPPPAAKPYSTDPYREPVE
ncbi:MAG: hypothetical protein WAN50_04775 [Minisyncoccia bacterium]